METQILCEDLLGAKLSDIGLSVDLTATVLHARYLENTAFRDLDLEMVLNAVFALLVAAGKAKHFALIVAFIADRANYSFSFLLDLVFFVIWHLAILRLLRLFINPCYTFFGRVLTCWRKKRLAHFVICPGHQGLLFYHRGQGRFAFLTIT